MRQLTHSEYDEFVVESAVAVIHFDAVWDAGLRDIVRRSMLEAEHSLGAPFSFAEVDCDENVDLSRSIPIENVPTVVYYKGGELVAALIGANQNVRARSERVFRGDPIGYDDGTTSLR